MLTCSGNHIKTQNLHFKIHFYALNHLQCFTPWHNKVKYLTVQSNVLSWGGKTISSPTKIQFFFFFKSPQLQIASATHQTIQWQTIIKLLWKLLCRKMWPVQCTFVHKKQFYDLAHTKVRRPSQVTRQRQGRNVFKLLLAPTFDPRTQDGFS